MPTINQLARNPRKTKKRRKKNLALSSGWNAARRSYFSQNSPQKSGICEKIWKMTPRKPNSALRSCARIVLSNKMKVTAYIPGEGNNLQEYSSVLIRGGKVKDLPGVKYHVILGTRDAAGVAKRRQGRSLYGNKKVKSLKK